MENAIRMGETSLQLDAPEEMQRQQFLPSRLCLWSERFGDGEIERGEPHLQFEPASLP